jgi:hypothetical protein
MTSELSLFLGSHTDKFTDWLHVVLEKLESFVGGSSTSDKVKEVTPVMPKAGSETCSLPVKVENQFPTAKHSSSGLLVANQMEVQNIATTSHNIPTNLELNKEPYVPMPVSLHSLPPVQVHHSPEGDMDDDCLNIREETEQDFRGSEDKLLKKRNSSSANYHVYELHSECKRLFSTSFMTISFSSRKRFPTRRSGDKPGVPMIDQPKEFAEKKGVVHEKQTAASHLKWFQWCDLCSVKL